MVLTRRSLLCGAAALVAACGRTADRRLIVVAARGGWDPLFAVDPKLGVSGLVGPEAWATGGGTESVETFSGLPIAVNDVRRPSVTRLFERWSGRALVVNGIDVGTIAHTECQRRMWSGSRDPDAPDIAARVGAMGGRVTGCLDLGPGVMAGPYAATTTRIGVVGQVDGLAPPEWADRAGPALERWRRRRGGGHDVEAERLVAALPLGLDPEDPVGAAVAALRADLCASVYLDPHGLWDTHADNDAQHDSWDDLAAQLDDLATRLGDAGLLDGTLILALSEMGRIPMPNAAGGKDHWPATSALLLGGGVAGGRVVGGTDDGLAPVGCDPISGGAGSSPLTPAHLLAGVLQHLGLDAAEAFPGVPPLALG